MSLTLVLSSYVSSRGVQQVLFLRRCLSSNPHRGQLSDKTPFVYDHRLHVGGRKRRRSSLSGVLLSVCAQV